MKKRNAFVITTALVSSSLFLLDGNAHAATQKGTVINAYHLNMRQSPSSNSHIVAVLDKGDSVTILNGAGSWDYVQYGSKKGYIYDKYLKVQNVSAPATVSTNGNIGTVVNASKLNMRQYASAASNSRIVAVLDKGDKVTVLRKVGSWYQISSNGKTGYVNSKYLSVSSTVSQGTPNTPVNTSSSGTVVNASKLNMRQYASAASNSRIVAVLDKGDKVTVLKKVGSWYQINYNGKTGYVNGKYISLSTTSTPVSPKPTPPPTQPTTPVATGTYKVVVGDTLSKIALKYNTTVQNLKNLNGLHTDLIRVGQVLKVTGTATVQPTPTTKTLVGKSIVLDPGHAENRVGARGNGLQEENLTWDMAVRTKSILESKGAKVTLTRTATSDCAGAYAAYSTDLACRPQVAERIDADAFVSLHFNAGVSSAYGTESFYYNNNDVALANQILTDYIKETGLRYRRVSYANFSVLRNSPTVPSTLIELAFLTNPNEAANYKTESFKNKAANGIAQGIENYLLK